MQLQNYIHASGTDAEYILFLTDFHSGDTYGLLNPSTTLEYNGPDGRRDIQKPVQTRWQQRIWGIVVDALNAYHDTIQDAPVVLVVGGDCIQGTRYLTHLITPSITQQLQIAAEAIEYIFTQLNIKRVFLAYGTEAHVGIDGDGEGGLVPLIDRPNRPVVATPMARVNVGGGDVFISHHGFYVGDAHLRGNAGRLMLQRRMVDDMMLLGKRPPVLYLSGHVHKYGHFTHIESIGGEDIESHAVVCPALCPMNGYARMRTKSQPILSTGVVLIKMAGGRVEWVNRDFIQFIDMRENYGYPDGNPGVMAHPYRNAVQQQGE